MTQATIGKWKLKLGDGASPEAFTAIEEVFEVGGLGKTNNLVNATNFDSPPGTMEYIAGLADGSEINITANYIPDATQQGALQAAVDAQENRNFQLIYDESASPAGETFEFTATCLGWTIVPSVEDRNQIQFTIKVSGDITVA